MAAINTTSTLAGLFKEVYGDNIFELAKYEAKLCNMVPFEQRDLIGNKFHVPVSLQLEHGFAYSAAGTTPSAPTIVTGQMADAQVDGVQLLGATSVDYEAIAKSLGGDKKAFIQATKMAVKTLTASAAKRLEMQFLHGRRGIGVVNADPGTGTTLVISEASWSPGIWAGMVGAKITFTDSDYTTAHAAGGPYTVSAVNMSTRTITVGSSFNADVEVDDIVWLSGGSTTTEWAGLDAVARNTGTLHNISASTYELWGGNVYSTSTGPISMAKILSAIGDTASYGANKDVVAVVSPKAFEVLNADQAALRQYPEASSKAKNGFGGIVYGCQVGNVTVLPHALQKDGMCHIFCPEETSRVGAADLTFIKRHGTDEVLILEDASYGAAMMRIYSHQNLFVSAPRHVTVLDGITY